jgi:hypothetical protein
MDVPSEPPSNGHTPPGIHERIEALEEKARDISGLRRDLERTFRVVLEIQVEMRNNHRAMMDKLEKLGKAP